MGGYCFTMAGVWLALSAIADKRASLARLALMSLCFGLAAGSRPPLVVTALILVPVFIALRSTQPRRGLLLALATPVCVCFLLIAAYNYARYGDPLEIGTRFQLNGAYHVQLAELGYVPIGMWSYLLTPPRIGVLFPFISIANPALAYPLSLPAHYARIPEETGGLLPMTPIAILLAALPLIWRRRQTFLGSLGPFILSLVGVGLGIMLILSYELFTTTERYEADYTTLFVFAALLVWLALSAHARGGGRRLLRVGGGLLAVWSCVTGMALGLQQLQQKHSDTWRTLVNIGSPLSVAIAGVVGHPILAEVNAPDTRPKPLTLTTASAPMSRGSCWGPANRLTSRSSRPIVGM